MFLLNCRYTIGYINPNNIIKKKKIVSLASDKICRFQKFSFCGEKKKNLLARPNFSHQVSEEQEINLKWPKGVFYLIISYLRNKKLQCIEL
jgi:hypothetical protein